MEQTEYYTSNRIKLVKDIRSYIKLIRPMLADKFGAENVPAIIDKSIAEYEKLIPRFPYIGGKENGLTRNLVQASMGIAFYRAIAEYGGTVENTGELLVQAMEKSLDRMPGFLRRIMGRTMFSRKRFEGMRRRAENSQKRQYPGDWVWSIHKSDGSDYDIGIDYTECGIKKFVYSEGLPELLPYLCNLDYALFGKLGLTLNRTKNLAHDDCCNFRISREGTPPVAWPPQPR